MANTSSAKKAARQALRRTEVNKARKSRMRTYLRKVDEATGWEPESADVRFNGYVVDLRVDG